MVDRSVSVAQVWDCGVFLVSRFSSIFLVLSYMDGIRTSFGRLYFSRHCTHSTSLFYSMFSFLFPSRSYVVTH